MLPLIAPTAELVGEWIDGFPMTVHVSDRVDYIFTANLLGQFTQKQHKEELPNRRVVDAADRRLIAVAVEKYQHPPEHQHPHIHNPVTGCIRDFFILAQIPRPR